MRRSLLLASTLAALTVGTTAGISAKKEPAPVRTVGAVRA